MEPSEVVDKPKIDPEEEESSDGDFDALAASEGSSEGGSDEEGESGGEAGKKRSRKVSSGSVSSSDSEDSLCSDTFDTIDKSNIVTSMAPIPDGKRATRSTLRAAAVVPTKKPRTDGEEDGEAELSD